MFRSLFDSPASTFEISLTIIEHMCISTIPSHFYLLQIVKMMVVLVLLYLLTLFPGRFLRVIDAEVLFSYESEQIRALLEMLRSLNSCVNIVIYTAMSE